MQEYLIGFLVLVNTGLLGFLMLGLFKFFPKISHSQVHRASTKQLMETDAARRDPSVAAQIAAEAADQAKDPEKPFGITADQWQRAREMAELEGCGIDDALLAVQSDEGGFDPRGVG